MVIVHWSIFNCHHLTEEAVSMRNFVGLLTIALALVVAAGVVAAQQSGSNSVPPPWAFGFATPLTPGAAAPAPPAAPAAPPAPDTTMHKLPGSQFSFMLNQIRDQYGPADWFPGDHPQMPDVVAHGKRDQMVAACSLCHYPNGKGRPENAGVSGLPYSYFVQTMMDFKNDKRKSSDTRKANTNGAGKTTQCAVCHGANLQGLGPVPGIAGRSPSYLVRQLYDMQVGSRKGEWTDLMKPVVAKLTAEDMINIVAYTASRPAGEARTSGGGGR